jgi:hypothetical protein
MCKQNTQTKSQNAQAPGTCSRPLFSESGVRVQDFDFGINERDLHKLFPKIELPAIVSTMTKVLAPVVTGSKFVLVVNLYSRYTYPCSH